MRLDDEALRTVFRCFDMDHSGGIDLNELHSAISLLGIPHMSKQKVEKMFADADEDGNGEIDFDEVCVVSRPLRKTPPPRCLGLSLTRFSPSLAILPVPLGCRDGGWWPTSQDH